MPSLAQCSGPRYPAGRPGHAQLDSLGKGPRQEHVVRRDGLAHVTPYRREVKGVGLFATPAPVEQRAPATTKAVFVKPGEQRLAPDDRVIRGADGGERVVDAAPIGSGGVSRSTHEAPPAPSLVPRGGSQPHAERRPRRPEAP